MDQDTKESNFAADVEFIAWQHAISPPAAARRSLKIAMSVALLASGSALFAELGPTPWQSGNGFRFAEIVLPKSGKPGFVKLDAASIGISFTNLLSSERSMTNSPLNNGSGIAAGDVDGDGRCDLYFCGLENANALYQNLGTGQFRDISEQAVVACAGQFSTGAVLADLDGDGDLDLAVNALGGGTRLFLNDGTGHFMEVTQRAGLTSHAASMALAVADFDADGNLDIYVTNYRSTVLIDEPDTRFTVNLIDGKPRIVKVNGLSVTAPGLVGRFSIGPSGGPLEHGEADVLYHNDGKGHFVPVSWIDGTFLDEDGNPLSTPPYDWGLGVVFRDLNGDGAPALYVCNDSHSPDRIWINLGRGRFQAIARTAIRKTSLSSMGVDVADINRDGLDEIFVLDMLSRDHQINNVLKAEKKLTSVQQLFLRKLLPSYATSPKIYRNRGDLTFEDRSREWGFSYVGVSQGMCLADLDNDGDLDVVVNNLNGPAGIYRNESNAPRVAVRLKGLPPNTHGIGAKIWLYGGAAPMQSQEMICGGRYLSSD